MNKELQDKAWSVLPKEFKEEVNKMFQKDINTCNSMNQAMRCILVDIFGLHNLTSDAEGEEMLMCDRNTVRMLYDRTDSVKVRQTLKSLFGSKCLPDKVVVAENATTSELKSTEPKKESRNLSQETANCDKQLDNILKDSFRNERRLNIAAMVIASIMGSNDWSDYRGATDEDVWHNMAKASLGVADALLSECEKGGSDENQTQRHHYRR